MIGKDGSLRCDGCGKKLASELKGEVKIVCPRCKRYNVFKDNFATDKKYCREGGSCGMLVL